MICNVQPSDGGQNSGQIIRHVQLPATGTDYVGREITIVMHGISRQFLDNIRVKPG